MYGYPGPKLLSKKGETRAGTMDENQCRACLSIRQGNAGLTCRSDKVSFHQWSSRRKRTIARLHQDRRTLHKSATTCSINLINQATMTRCGLNPRLIGAFLLQHDRRGGGHFYFHLQISKGTSTDSQNSNGIRQF